MERLLELESSASARALSLSDRSWSFRAEIIRELEHA